MGISLVIPVHNEEQFIANVLQRIYSLLGNLAEFEVIVVDNASTDSSLAILERFSSIHLMLLRDKRTVSAVRNLGWKQAKYELVAFIDGDVLITRQWIEELLSIEAMVLEGDVIVGATYDVSEQPGWIETSWFTGMKRQNRKYINGGNLITTKKILKKLGGFNEQLISAEDVDICRRAAAMGIEVRANEKLHVMHEGYPKTWRAFFRRELWHGAGDMQSFHRFIQSKTAVMSVLQILLLATSVTALVLLPGFFGVLGIVFCLAMNIFVVFKKFHVVGNGALLQLLVLMYVYQLARCMSFFRSSRV